MPDMNVFAPLADLAANTRAEHVSAVDPRTRFRAIDPHRPVDPQLAVLYDIQKKYVDVGGEPVLGSMIGNPRALATSWNCDNGYLVWNGAAPGGVYAVHGAIHQRYRTLGGPRSYLGQPVSDEHDFDGGRTSTFEHGAIYWWPDTGEAIDLRGVSLALTGVICEDETDPEPGGKDDIYVVVTWIANVPGPGNAGVVSSPVFEETFDDGTAVPTLIPCYAGPPHGLVLDVAVFEHGLGDPDAARRTIKTILETNHELGHVALGFIPLVGAVLQQTLSPVLESLIPSWTSALADLLHVDERLIGRRSMTLTPRDMVLRAARETNRERQGIGYTLDTGDISGLGGAYKVCFGLAPA